MVPARTVFSQIVDAMKRFVIEPLSGSECDHVSNVSNIKGSEKLLRPVVRPATKFSQAVESNVSCCNNWTKKKSTIREKDKMGHTYPAPSKL